MDSVNEFAEFLTERRAEVLASPRTGSRAAAAPASESPVDDGLGLLLAATGATGGSIRQSIGFTRPSSTPGDASTAGDDGAADVADLVNALSAIMSPAASKQLKGLLAALDQATRIRNTVMVEVLRTRIDAIIAAETTVPRLTARLDTSLGSGSSSRGSTALTAADNDLQQAFDLHVGGSDIFGSGSPVLMLT